MPATIILKAAKMIKDSGAAAAIKKYGKEVYDEAKKHIKDMKTAKTAGQKQTEKATRQQYTYREGQRSAAKKGATVGGIAGYTAGGVELSGDSSGGSTSLPIADMSQGVDVRGTGDGIRYFQNGKEVRLPKKSYN